MIVTGPGSGCQPTATHRHLVAGAGHPEVGEGLFERQHSECAGEQVPGAAADLGEAHGLAAGADLAQVLGEQHLVEVLVGAEQQQVAAQTLLAGERVRHAGAAVVGDVDKRVDGLDVGEVRYPGSDVFAGLVDEQFIDGELVDHHGHPVDVVAVGGSAVARSP